MQLQTEKRAPMSENPFSAFIDLITLDQKIRTLHDQILTLKKEMQEDTALKNEITIDSNSLKIMSKNCVKWLMRKNLR